MTESSWLDHEVEKFSKDPGFIAEGVALALVEQMLALMEERGISRADMAQRMGGARLTQIMNCLPNLTPPSSAGALE